jgi:thiamine-phosphate pyrophosphorylase
VSLPEIHPSANDPLHAWRVLDANANRAAEGLRTLEDYARLVRENRAVAAELKQLRHRLTEVLSCLSRSERLLARATHSDAGTSLSTPQEVTRAELAEVVPAACERVSQALRNLEEFSKPISATAGAAFKQLRYAAYDILASAELRLQFGVALSDSQRLYLLIDCSLSMEDFQHLVASLAGAGVDLFQLRDKQADGGRLMRYARAAVATLRDTPAKLIVNDRIDVALASGAAGVHLGQDDMSLQDARNLAGAKLWVGISTHNVEQAQAAEHGGADYIGCGPTFPSQTKQFEAFAGTQFLSQAVEQISVPIFAIGGIELDNLDQVLLAGCQRVALSGAILKAPDPVQAARALSAKLISSAS